MSERCVLVVTARWAAAGGLRVATVTVRLGMGSARTVCRVPGAALRALVRRTVPGAVDVVLDQIDLTALVLDRLDLAAVLAQVPVDEVVARVDVDAVAARLDLDAVVARADLGGIVREVLDEVDLAEIVRESTGAMTSETVRTVRMQGIGADERVNRLLGRLLPRRAPEAGTAPVAPQGPGDVP